MPENVSSKCTSKVIKDLCEENEKVSWDGLENLILHTSIGRSLDTSDVSLHKAIILRVSNDCLRSLIKNGSNVNQLIREKSVLEFAAEMDMLEICAILIKHGALLRPGGVNRSNQYFSLVIRCIQTILATGRYK